MKKLSKKDEALDVVRQMVADGQVSQEVAEKYFPELKSEDERIKKEIISFVEQAIDAGYGIIDKERKDKWIAWLEKQGEQKHVVIIPKFRVGDEIKTSNEESLTITKIDEKGYWSKDLFI